MKKNLLFVVCSCLLLCIGSAAMASTSPTFTGGHVQNMPACESAGLYPINSLLTINDADAGESETWTVVNTAAHGALVASYSTTSTGTAIIPTGLSYTPTVGYVGTDSFTVEISDGTFADTTTIYVTISPAPPAAGPLTGSATLCVGSTVTLSAPSTGGTWSASNANASVSGSAVTGATGGIDTIKYVTSNTCGMDSATFVVTIDTGIVPVAPITGNDTICVGSTITLSDAVSGGTWSHTAATGSITGAGVLSAPSAATGTDTVIYSRTNGCGTSHDVKAITITPLPDAGIITGYDSVCAGSSISLTTTGTGGVWTSSIPDFASVDASGHVHGALNGTAVIRYIVANVCGSDTTSHPVAINTPAQPILGENTICQFAPTMLFDAVAGGTWSSSDFLTVAIFAGNVVGIQLGTATVTYTVHNACGTSTATIDITVIDCGTGVDNVTNSASTLGLFPNPNSGSVTISLQASVSNPASVIITNILGAKVKEFTMNTNTATIDMDVPAGIYFLSATANNKQYTAKMVVAK